MLICLVLALCWSVEHAGSETLGRVCYIISCFAQYSTIIILHRGVLEMRIKYLDLEDLSLACDGLFLLLDIEFRTLSCQLD